MNLRRIESFMAVAELGSFSAASEALHRSPSAVTTHVRQLETELQVGLFDRTTRKVSLTPEGRLLLARCRTVVAELEDASRELSEHSQLRRGHVSIGAVPSVSSLRLPAALAALQQRHPGITLEVHEAAISAIHRDLRERVTDFAIAPSFGNANDLSHEVILSDPFVAVLPRRLRHQRDSITLAELAHHKQLAQGMDTAVRNRVEQVFRDQGLPFRPAIEVSHHQTVVNMVAAGLGVALLPRLCVTEGAVRGCRVVALRPAGLAREICIVRLRGRSPSPASVEFARTIAGMLQAAERPAGRRQATRS